MIPKGATVIAITRGLMYDPKVSIDKHPLILSCAVNLFIIFMLAVYSFLLT